ncbi:hypothetical protein AAFF_G00316660 [Aldrovandia affinis]|uniref:Uncharacterized protein n=1 Tax=Aldrovandia affinis TaxID=143900 RepID=A0AAD7WQH4_9TELE|nr:hypothetical protein AAFF_G00316660 [Aldrovandia affinis]
MEWAGPEAGNNLDEYTDTVTSFISFCEEVCVPVRTRKIYNNDKPWFTAQLRRLRSEKEEARRSGDKDRFKEAKYRFAKAAKEAKHRFSEKLQQQFSEGNPASVWKGLKTITNYKSPQTSDNLSLANELNEFYCRFEKERVIALFSSDRDVDVKDVLAYELAPVPTAMFTEDGMRICKAKSTLKKSLQIEVSRRNAGDADVTVIDGSALLWTIHWPADGTVADFIENVKTRLTSYLSESDVYLIFDRYYDYSIKSVTRDVRETGVNKKHHLLLSTKLPAQKVVLSSIENKKQLNLLLCEELTQDRLFHLRSTNKHKLVVTGEDPCPIEIKMEERRTRYDLENQQEEADTIIVQQVLGCAGEAHQISVVSDDTDVFVLLLHHYHQAGLDVPLIMESPAREEQ